MWVFLYMEYDKFQSILLEHFIELKPLIFEECILKFLFVVMNFFHPFVNFVETRVLTYVVYYNWLIFIICQ